jgi:hypothetical protein
MTLLAMAFTGLKLVRSIWAGRPVRVRRYRSLLVVEVAAGLLLSWPASRVEETIVASTAVASGVEAPACGNLAGATAFHTHGERILVAGTGLPAPGCGIWAIMEDRRGGGLWLQGPATLRDSGWELDLVLGTGELADEVLRYHMSLVAVAAPMHEAWNDLARQQGVVRLGDRPSSTSRIGRDRDLELRRGRNVVTIGEERDVR